MCSELCKDFYVVYQLEMVAGEVESSCQLVVTFFFFGLTLPNYRNKSGSAQRSPPLYQLLPPPLVDINSVSKDKVGYRFLHSKSYNHTVTKSKKPNK